MVQQTPAWPSHLPGLPPTLPLLLRWRACWVCRSSVDDPRQLKRPLLDFPRSQVAWLFKLTVNPLLNSAGRHAHEIRLRLAVRNGIADLELPFPQPRLYLGKAEFNTPAVHV